MQECAVIACVKAAVIYASRSGYPMSTYMHTCAVFVSNTLISIVSKFFCIMQSGSRLLFLIHENCIGKNMGCSCMLWNVRGKLSVSQILWKNSKIFFLHNFVPNEVQRLPNQCVFSLAFLAWFSKCANQQSRAAYSSALLVCTICFSTIQIVWQLHYGINDTASCE